MATRANFYSSCRLAPTAIAATVVISAMLCWCQSSRGDDQKHAAHIGEAWTRWQQQKPVGNARVRLSRYSNSLYSGKLTLSTIDNILSGGGECEAIFDKINTSFGTETKAGFKGMVGVQVDITFDGNRLRNDFIRDGDPLRTSLVNDRELLEYRPGGKQADINTVASSRSADVLRLNGLIFAPTLSASAKIEHQPGKNIATVLTDSYRVECNDSTGFVHVATELNKPGVRWRVYQLQPVEAAGSIVAARLRVECVFDDAGAIQRLNCYLLKDIALGAVPPADSFRLSVPKGTTVVDFRNGEGVDPPRRRAEARIDDVKEYIESKALLASPQLLAPSEGTRSIGASRNPLSRVLMVSIVVLIVVVFFARRIVKYGATSK